MMAPSDRESNPGRQAYGGGGGGKHLQALGHLNCPDLSTVPNVSAEDKNRLGVDASITSVSSTVTSS